MMENFGEQITAEERDRMLPRKPAGRTTPLPPLSRGVMEPKRSEATTEVLKKTPAQLKGISHIRPIGRLKTGAGERISAF